MKFLKIAISFIEFKLYIGIDVDNLHFVNLLGQ